MKKCTKCGEIKRSEMFVKKTNYCKSCNNAYYAIYRKSNRERVREWDRKYQKHNREKVNGWKKKYKKNNFEKVMEYNRKYRKNNPEKIMEAVNKWRKSNREKVKESNRKYRKNIIKNLYPAYIKRLLEGSGFTKEIINQ